MRPGPAHRQVARLALATALALVAAAPLAGRAAAQAPADAPPVLHLTAGDGGLAWDVTSTSAPIALSATAGGTVQWDLSELDRDRYRSDLVRFQLDHAEGPGHFVATVDSSLGHPETLVDTSTDRTDFVLQVGRKGSMTWAFDRAGDYEIQFTATIPKAGGGVASATASYAVAVAPPAPGEPLVDQAVTAAPRVLTSAEATYTFVVGDIADPGGRLVLDVGHADAIAPTLVDGELLIQVKDDTQLHDPGVVYRDPADVSLQVLPEAEMPIPASPAFGFLGTAGDPVWMLPMAQDPALLWPGWSTEHPSLAGEFDELEFEITGIDGPGDLHLFLTDTFGSPIHRANSLGDLSNTWTEQVPAHVHANWVFTQPGSYEVTVQASGTWLNAPAAPSSTTTTTTTAVAGVTTTIPSGGAASTTSLPAGTGTTSTTPGSGATGTTTTTAPSRSGTGGSGRGPIASAGASVGVTAAVALGLVAAGAVLVRIRRVGASAPGIARDRPPSTR